MGPAPTGAPAEAAPAPADVPPPVPVAPLAAPPATPLPPLSPSVEKTGMATMDMLGKEMDPSDPVRLHNDHYDMIPSRLLFLSLSLARAHVLSLMHSLSLTHFDSFRATTLLSVPTCIYTTAITGLVRALHQSMSVVCSCFFFFAGAAEDGLPCVFSERSTIHAH
jgi:hypothetical protein